MFDNLQIVDIVSFTLSIIGVMLSTTSIILAYTIFIRNQKNYYKLFLFFLNAEKRKLQRFTKRLDIKGDLIIDYIIENVRFFAEDFFVNFAGEGNLKYQQFQTILGIYGHIRRRLKITRKVFKRANKVGAKNILIYVQIFDKFNNLNEKYFDNKIKNAKLKRDDSNVYTTLVFSYDKQNREIYRKSEESQVFYSMGSDIEFKKNIYYIFSTENRIENTLEGEDLEKSYFFIACYYSTEKIKDVTTDKVLEKEKKVQ